jgi:hypothetical protein
MRDTAKQHPEQKQALRMNNMRKAQIALVRLQFKPFDESGFAP